MDHERFWNWFRTNADIIASGYDGEQLTEGLAEKIESEWPELSWEIGPDPSGCLYLSISPNLNKGLIPQANKAVGSAPSIPGWKFYPYRQRKKWDGRFEMHTSRGVAQIDSSSWNFVLLRYPDGGHEVFLIGDKALWLNEEDRWQAAAIVVEGMIGEKCILENDLSFSLDDRPEPQFEGKEKPIRELPGAFGLGDL